MCSPPTCIHRLPVSGQCLCLQGVLWYDNNGDKFPRESCPSQVSSLSRSVPSTNHVLIMRLVCVNVFLLCQESSSSSSHGQVETTTAKSSSGSPYQSDPFNNCREQTVRMECGWLKSAKASTTFWNWADTKFIVLLNPLTSTRKRTTTLSGLWKELGALTRKLSPNSEHRQSSGRAYENKTLSQMHLNKPNTNGVGRTVLKSLYKHSMHRGARWSARIWWHWMDDIPLYMYETSHSEVDEFFCTPVTTQIFDMNTLPPNY